jgi:TolB protein
MAYVSTAVTHYPFLAVITLAGNGTRIGGVHSLQPSWAPQGDAIAYLNINCCNALRIHDLATSLDRTVSTSVYPTLPKWSPDGSRLAFVGRTDANSQNVYTIHPDGSAQVQLSSDTGRISGLSWSPDGRKIAFDRNNASTGPRIFVIDLAGGDPSLLTSGMSAVWSPDGSQIALEDYGIFTINADGSGRVYRATGSDPAWSPDGVYISFTHGDLTSSRIGVLKLSTGDSYDVQAPAGSTDMLARWRPR